MISLLKFPRPPSQSLALLSHDDRPRGIITLLSAVLPWPCWRRRQVCHSGISPFWRCGSRSTQRRWWPEKLVCPTRMQSPSGQFYLQYHDNVSRMQVSDGNRDYQYLQRKPNISIRAHSPLYMFLIKLNKLFFPCVKDLWREQSYMNPSCGVWQVCRIRRSASSTSPSSSHR